jgi:hypothetical protein
MPAGRTTATCRKVSASIACPASNPAGLVLDLLKRQVPDIQRLLQVTPQRIDLDLSDD